jgi:DNA-binding NtrC family response regulator
MNPERSILVVDDEPGVRLALQVNLARNGLNVRVASDAKEAAEILRAEPFDLVLTDVRMPGASGLDLVQKIHEAWPEMAVIVMTGQGSVADAVEAIRAGASDYIQKPVRTDALLLTIERALEHRALRAEVRSLRREVTVRFGFERLIGQTDIMQRLYKKMSAVADSSATVLLEGPTGTGKELIAHAIHVRSRRNAGTFVRVNCAAIPEALLESELFGHERGAFTGAVRQHAGRFEQAEGGTLLLDEIGEIEPHVQVKLLRVLENGEIQRVGGKGMRRVDVRVIAATNKDLLQEVHEGRFREDLYYRLYVVCLKVPSLTARKEDIPLLVDHFLRVYAEQNERAIPEVARSAMLELMAYGWPGNVRQLEHLIERTLILNPTDFIERFEMPETARTGDAPAAPALPAATALHDALQQLERRLIVQALRRSGGVQARAARELEVSRSNLNYRIKKLGIVVRDIGRAEDV